MRVLFFVRANHDKVNGGDLVQIDLTAKYLRKAGVIVDYSSDVEFDLSVYDIVHCFNSPRFEETKRFFEAAKIAQKPIAFSTIYWPKTEYVVGVSRNVLVRTALLLLSPKLTCAIVMRLMQLKDKLRPNQHRAIEKWLFSNADMLLPNSVGEMQQIRDYYGVRERAFHSVRNAVESDVFSDKKTGLRSGVLSVGRIEPRKNTMKLIEACNDLGLPLTLIGGHNTDDSYASACLTKMKEYGFTYISNIPSKDLVEFYYAAEVHAMVSWYETPGLATMEAAAAGCKIVTTDRGSTTEYFDDTVAYCDPFSYTSIKDALYLVATSKVDPGLSRKIRNQYTWGHTAQDTIAAYKELLA